jgi:hypothetical protein
MCLGQLSIFFIPTVQSPPGAVRHVAAPELPSQEGRVSSHETRDSTGTHLIKEAMIGAKGHVVAPKLISAMRQESEVRDTWERRSSPQQGGNDLS